MLYFSHKLIEGEEKLMKKLLSVFLAMTMLLGFAAIAASAVAPQEDAAGCTCEGCTVEDCVCEACGDECGDCCEPTDPPPVIPWAPPCGCKRGCDEATCKCTEAKCTCDCCRQLTDKELQYLKDKEQYEKDALELERAFNAYMASFKNMTAEQRKQIDAKMKEVKAKVAELEQKAKEAIANANWDDAKKFMQEAYLLQAEMYRDAYAKRIPTDILIALGGSPFTEFFRFAWAWIRRWVLFGWAWMPIKW